MFKQLPQPPYEFKPSYSGTDVSLPHYLRIKTRLSSLVKILDPPDGVFIDGKVFECKRWELLTDIQDGLYMLRQEDDSIGLYTNNLEVFEKIQKRVGEQMEIARRLGPNDLFLFLDLEIGSLNARLRSIAESVTAIQKNQDSLEGEIRSFAISEGYSQ